MRLPIVCCLVLLTIAFPAQSRGSPLVAGPKVYLDLPSEPLDQALMDVGKRTDLVVIVDPSTGAHGMKSESLKGSFTADEAFHQLLAPTDLQIKLLRENTLLVTAPDPIPPPLRVHPPEGAAMPQKPKIIVITASQIRDHGADDSNLTTYSSDDFPLSGAITTEQFVRGLPQSFALLNAQTTIAATINPQAGTNVARGEAMNLLGINPGATLVLLDGVRVAPSGIDGSFVDVSLVPRTAVEHVDVLTDGASATYGSDAVAGVVNFVLRREFQGLAVAPYSAVTGGGGRERGISVLGGDKWTATDGFTASYEHYEQQALNSLSRNTLVPQVAPFQVVPAQVRNSGVLTMHQALSTWMELAADGIGSERTFGQTYLSESPGSTQSRGRAGLWGGNVHAVFKLPGDWQSDVIGAYTREAETVTNSAESIVQSFRTRSSMASMDWRADGTAFSIMGRPIELSAGGAWRRETFDDLQERSGLARDVLGNYASARVLVVRPDDARWWAKRVELGFAVRHDDYRHGGPANAASDNPRAGLLWSPRAELTLRGTYATSFRMPPLAQLQESTDTALLIPISEPSVPGQSIGTAYITGGNRALQPEVAKSFTAGVDVKSSSTFKFSATYIHVDYRNRIATPPVVGPVTSIYGQLDMLRPYINLTPSAADVQALYDHYKVFDSANVGASGIRAIFDSRLRNIAATEASGVQILATGTLPTDVGHLQLRLEGQYLAELKSQATPTTPYASPLNTVFNVPRWRGQGIASWSLKGLAASAMLDFTGSYRDTLVASAPNVASWLIVDCRVAYTTGNSFGKSVLGNTTFAMTIHNCTNRSPPYVAGLADATGGYDPSHASPLGRSILLMVSKLW